MRKSVKSNQNQLNELYLSGENALLTASGYSQVREHLSHRAYIELNREVLMPYSWEEPLQRYRGFRLLAGDGSRIRLPHHPTTRQTFGGITTCTGMDNTVTGEYPCGQAFVLHDVLNKVAIDGQLVSIHSYEVDLAIQALAYTDENDLLIFDRGFATFRFLATLCQQQRHFVIRCSSGSFVTARALFAANQETSQTVILLPTTSKKKLTQAGLPPSLTLRFVAVRLSTGELEVLVTSLLDSCRFPSAEFKQIYHFRWGVETLYDLFKNRLTLENFSGKTDHAVQQDFHATLFLTNLESLLSRQADSSLILRSQPNRLGQTVNNMVSFHALKSQLFPLLASDLDPALVLDTLTQLFLMNPTYTRRNRSVPRRKPNLAASLHYHKRLRKHCF